MKINVFAGQLIFRAREVYILAPSLVLGERRVREVHPEVGIAPASLQAAIRQAIQDQNII